MSGCTNCGNKGGCDSRKHEMFGAIDEALARLYPTRRWDERDEAAGFGAGLGAGRGTRWRAPLAARLHAATLYRPGAAEETCDYVYVLCLGRTPSLVELRESALDGTVEQALRAAVADGPMRSSTCAWRCRPWRRFAARPGGGPLGDGRAHRRDDRADARRRAPGVFAPVLLKRLPGAGRGAGRDGTSATSTSARSSSRPRASIRAATPSATAALPASPTTSSIPQPPSAIATTTLT